MTSPGAPARSPPHGYRRDAVDPTGPDAHDDDPVATPGAPVTPCWCNPQRAQTRDKARAPADRSRPVNRYCVVWGPMSDEKSHTQVHPARLQAPSANEWPVPLPWAMQLPSTYPAQQPPKGGAGPAGEHTGTTQKAASHPPRSLNGPDPRSANVHTCPPDAAQPLHRGSARPAGRHERTGPERRQPRIRHRPDRNPAPRNVQ